MKSVANSNSQGRNKSFKQSRGRRDLQKDTGETTESEDEFVCQSIDCIEDVKIKHIT